MENQKLNIQTLVAVVFIFLLVAAAVTTVFAQEQNTDKKERTQYIQLKIVEDENGDVKSIDTTFVMDDEMNEMMEDAGQKMKAYSFSFENEFNNVDSLMEVIVKQYSEHGDSLMTKRFQHHMKVDSDDDNVFIYSNGKKVNIEKDGKVKVIVLDDGSEKATWTRDTIIEDGNTKIIIKTNNDGDNEEQTIEYISVINDDEDVDIDKDVKVFKVKGNKAIWVDDEGKVIDLDGENYEFHSESDDPQKGTKVMVIKKNGSKNVWLSDENEVYVLDDSKYEFQPASDGDLKGLKEAGVKTKSRELQLENLKFSPNPSNGKFNLSFALKESKKVSIKIYDINGNVVYSETLKDFQGEYNKEIDISQQESGTFFLQIVQGLYDIIKKIIIQ